MAETSLGNLLRDAAGPIPRGTVLHALPSDYRVLIGYVFPSEGNPWLADWQENRRNKAIPWNGEVMARGLEFGRSPFAEGLRQSIQRASLFETASYRWIGARQRLKTKFTIVLTEIPEGFGGVKDLHTEHSVPILTPR